MAKQWWASSRVLGSRYLVNQKYSYFVSEWFIIFVVHVDAFMSSLVLEFCHLNTFISTNLQVLALWASDTLAQVQY